MSILFNDGSKKLNPQKGFNENSIQRQIQPLNPQMGFNVKSIKDGFNH